MPSSPSAPSPAATLIRSGLRRQTGLSWGSNLALLLIAVCLSWLAAYYADERQSAEAVRRLEEIVGRIDKLVVERMTLFQYGLRGLNGSVQAVGFGAYTREHFDRYSRSRDIHIEFPGARGFGLIRRVKADDTEAFIAAARKDGRPGFKLRELSPNPGERWIIQYISPASTNQQAEGLDIASEPMRRQAMEVAVDSGNPALTQPITLVQASGQKQAGFLLLRPIYRPGAKLDTPEERRAAALGLTYSPLLITEVLNKEDLYPLEIAIAIDSKNDQGQLNRFYETISFAALDQSITSQHAMPLFGVEWQLTARPTPAFFARLNYLQPAAVGLLTFLSLATLQLLVNLYRLARRRRLQLIDDQARLAAIVESANDAVIGTTIDGIVTSWNKAAQHMFGFTAQEAVGRTVAALIVPTELRHEETEILDRLRQGQPISNFVTHRRTKTHQSLAVSVSVSPIFSDAQQIIGAAKTIRDVTDQQMIEREVRELNVTLEQRVIERTRELDEARKSLRTILDAMPSLVGYWDKECRNGFANRAYGDWFNLPPERLMGMHMRELLGSDIYQMNLPYIRKALAGEPQSFERELTRRNGQDIRHAAINYLPKVSDGSTDGFYVIVHDVTEVIEARRRAQFEEIREQQVRMDRLASLGLMVAGVAHEMNTPLGAAMLTLDKLAEELAQFKTAFTSGLRKTDIERLNRQFDEGVAMTARYLARCAQVIRQFKQVASDRASAERRIFAAGEVVRDVIHLMDSQIRTTKIQLVLDLQGQIELDSYPGVLGQVLQNLVDNALLHAFDSDADGSITVAMRETGDGQSISLTVTDDGKGIPPALYERIWDPFFTTRRNKGGTGLGLHIVQQLVSEVLGGNIVHRPAPQGKGTEFAVILPKVAPQDPVAAQVPDTSGADNATPAPPAEAPPH